MAIFDLSTLIPGITGGTWYLQKQESNGSYNTNPTICTGNSINTALFDGTSVTLGNTPSGQVWNGKTATLSGNNLTLNSQAGVWRALYIVGNCGGTCYDTSFHNIVSIGEPIVPTNPPLNICADLITNTTASITLSALIAMAAQSNYGPGAFPDITTLVPGYTAPTYSWKYRMYSTTAGVTYTGGSTIGSGNTSWNGTRTDTVSYSGTLTSGLTTQYGQDGNSVAKTIFNNGDVLNFTVPAGTTSFTLKIEAQVTINTTPPCVKTYDIQTINVTLAGNAGNNTSVIVCA